jgi:hypothetical protein
MSISITIGALMGAAIGGTEVTPDLQTRLEAAEARIAELAANQDVDWMTEQRSEQIRGLVQDVLSDADTRASLQGNGATAGYNDGFFVQSADGKWSMKINGLFQERFNIGKGRNGPGNGAGVQLAGGGAGTNYTTVFGFETTRAVLNFSGTLAGDIYYNARLDWSPYNNGNASNNRLGGGLSNNELEWAYGGFSLNDNTKLQMGRQKFEVMRSFIVNAEDQMAIERGAGTYYWYTSALTNGIKMIVDQDNFRGNVMFSNGTGGSTGGGVGNNSYARNQHGWSVTGRGEFLLQGDWSQFDAIGSTRGEATGVLLGIGAGYLESQDRDATFDNVNNWLVSSDLSYNTDGWSMMVSATYGQNRSNATNNNSFGFEALAGYWLNDADQAYLRWQWLYPGTTAGVTSTRLDIVTVGLNHHMGGNVKLSVDWSFCFSDPHTTIVNGGSGGGYTGWWGGGANQTTGSQWLLRTQLQVSF